MAKINEQNYPRRQASEYASTDMLIVQPVPVEGEEHSGDSRTTRIEDLKEYMIGDADPSKIGTPAAGTYTSASNTNAENIASLDHALANFDHLTKQIATQEEINGYIADPTTADFNVIYLLKNTSSSGSDKYYEYMRLGTVETSTFEMTGDTSTDLSDYMTKTGDVSNTVETSITASSASYPEIAAGETLKVIFGKIKKYLSDLKGKFDTLKSKGSATKGVYFDANGDIQEMTYTVAKSVPSDAVFTDTTYSSKSASSGGTDVSLVTTGEKYTWNNKSTVSVAYSGTASSSAVRKQIITVNGTEYTVDGSVYMEQTLTFSASASTTVTFSNSLITTNSVIDVYTSVEGLNYTSKTISSGSCSIVYPAQSSQTSITVRIYIR